MILLNAQKSAELIFIHLNISFLKMTPFYLAFLLFIHSF